jgi:3-oxoacyl-[acyl-carrier protein] reductase
MLVQRQGAIINISSIIAQRGFSGLAMYAATKAGLEGLTRALARELGSRQIRVNAIAPGYLETEMSAALDEGQRQQIIRRTPLGRLGQVADVVPCVEFLLSPGARFITGQVITIDGGSTV